MIFVKTRPLGNFLIPELLKVGGGPGGLGGSEKHFWKTVQNWARERFPFLHTYHFYCGHLGLFRDVSVIIQLSCKYLKMFLECSGRSKVYNYSTKTNSDASYLPR